jgi:hypothetical protein
MGVILVSGAIANKPGNGGAAWTRMSWARGCAELGHDVYFIEQIDPQAGHGAAVSFFHRAIEQCGMSGRASLLSTNGETLSGLGAAEMVDVASRADLLINISGHLTLPLLKFACRRRAFVDLDPGYTQFWHAQGLAAGTLDGHDRYFTVGANIGRGTCPIPTGGIEWLPTRQPVALGDWPVAPLAGAPRFTTVASWRGAFGRVTNGSSTYGQKAHEFRKFSALPASSPWPLEIALDAHPADAGDVSHLRAEGWDLVDPGSVAADPASFREYIQRSAAEFSVAQGIYVETQSGWVSDRTVRYLASGKPALVQDTGSVTLPTGDGLLTFRTLDEARRGLDTIVSDYARHATAARRLAEEFFPARRVLGEFLEQCL